jgi:hypothetical protein
LQAATSGSPLPLLELLLLELLLLELLLLELLLLEVEAHEDAHPVLEQS